MKALFARRIVLVAAGLLVLVVLLALLVPLIWDLKPNLIKLSARLQAPSLNYWVGTDHLGRDVWVRMIDGARYSLLVGFATATGAVFFGVLLGMSAGFFKRLDAPFMRLADAMMAFPDILLGIALVAILGSSLWNVILALVIVYIPRIARVIRAATLVLREMLFVDAARALGVGSVAILWRHILPNLFSPMSVQFSFVFAYAILAEAGLSFLGVGVPASIPTWGTMIAASVDYADRALWAVVGPGLLIIFVALSLQIIGDGIRDMLDPRLRKTLS